MESEQQNSAPKYRVRLAGRRPPGRRPLSPNSKRESLRVAAAKYRAKNKEELRERDRYKRQKRTVVRLSASVSRRWVALQKQLGLPEKNALATLLMDFYQVQKRQLGEITAGSKSLRSCIGFHGWKDICFSDRLVKEITGVSVEVFNLLRTQLSSTHPTFGGLTRENGLLAFLMKLKMNTPFSHLAAQLSASQSTVEQTFMFVLLTLAELTSSLIQWPCKTTVKCTLPPFIQRSFPRCRLILDCLDIETEAPSALSNQLPMISSVNSAFVARVLIGLTPNGCVCFISKALSGNISQAILSKESSLLCALDTGDEVISLQTERWSLGIKGVKLHTAPINPAFPKRSPRYQDDTAALNSHFDKLKQRLSSFAILRSKIPLNLLPHLDSLVHVCAVLSNFDEATPRESAKV